MPEPLLVIDGHPDPEPAHFVHALAAACEAGAREAGRPVERLDIARLALPPLRSQAEWHAAPAAAIASGVAEAQEKIARARHIVLFYPLWLGAPPAAVKAFLEQTLRPGFATPAPGEGDILRARKLRGRTARIVVTMGMPAFVHRWWFGAHALKSLRRDVLGLCGIRPVRETLIGSVEAMGEARRRAWLERMRRLGAAGR